MCGRYTIYTKAEVLEERFHAHMVGEKHDYFPSYNVAPTQWNPVILNERPEEIVTANWGYIPHWAKNPQATKPMINARVETVAEKPYFRDSYKKRQCLVLADGFYEWDRKGLKKIPYFIKLKGDEPFAMAGIWDEIEESDGNMYKTFSIITSTPNKLLDKIHNRMPVILNKDEEAKWLEGALKHEALMSPYSDELMEMHPVSIKVNRPSFNTPSAIQPV
jgi:putative SOS response-associated peptidase YedK